MREGRRKRKRIEGGKKERRKLRGVVGYGCVTGVGQMRSFQAAAENNVFFLVKTPVQ